MSAAPAIGLLHGAKSRAACRAGGVLLAAFAVLALVSCSEDSAPKDKEKGVESGWSVLPDVMHPQPELAGLPTREQQYVRLCSAGRDDDFLRRICTTKRPDITSLKELIVLLGLDKNSAFAFTGNSTSLVMRAVSSVNPRAIIFPKSSWTAPLRRNSIS